MASKGTPVDTPAMLTVTAELATLGRLWSELNDPKRFGTPQSTIDAVIFSVKARGLAALQEPDTMALLAWCDDRAKAEINRRVQALIEKGAAA